MASPYGSGRTKRSSGGSAYGSGRSKASVKKKKRSFFDTPGLNILANAGREFSDIVTGGPAALYEIGKFIASTPGTGSFGKRSKENEELMRLVAEDYKYRYGPLFKGDFGEFAHRTGERPLSFALDVIPAAAATTKGLSLTGAIKPAARSIKLRSPGAVAGREGAPILERQIVGSDLGRRLRVGSDKLLKKLPPEFAVLGETQRYARQIRYREIKDYARLKLRAAPREVAKSGLSKNEFVAANIIADFPLKKDLDSLIASLKEVEGAGATVKLLESPKIRKLYDNPSPKMLRYIEEENKLIGHMEDIIPLSPEDALQRQYLPTLLARGAKFEDDILTAERPIAEMIEEISSEAKAAGRPEPRFRPQKSVDEKSGLAMSTGGTAAQRLPYRQNKGVLQAMGRVAYDIDTLHPQYMKTIKWATYSDRHADLVAAAKAVDTLPEGYQYVKRHLNEKIGYTERTAGEFDRRLDDFIDADDSSLAVGPTRSNELTTMDAAEAAVGADGRRLAVPERFAKTIVGEYQRSSKAMKWFWEKPTDVWRAVVLNLRVGWLVNNLIGNTLLYLLKNGGPEGLAAYFRSLGDTKLGKWIPKNAEKVLSPADMAEIFPEHVAGTFYGTQVPNSGIAGKAARYSPTRPLVKADVGYEQAMRRAMATKLARKHPKVKARVKEMPAETRSFRKAAREVLDEADIERISREINNALGDFFSLNATERGAVRRWIPFYAWYKAITLVTLKMPIDAPARTAILTNLGKIGAEASEDYGLPWLQGSIPLDDEGLSLGTKAANPWATVPDLGRGIFADDWFAARQRESVFNPIPEMFTKAVTTEGPLPERLGASLLEVARGLPPARLLFPEERESYEGNPRTREFYSYLGIPVRRVSPQVRNKSR